MKAEDFITAGEGKKIKILPEGVEMAKDYIAKKGGVIKAGNATKIAPNTITRITEGKVMYHVWVKFFKNAGLANQENAA